MGKSTNCASLESLSTHEKKPRMAMYMELTPALGRAEAEGSLGFAGVSLAPGSWRDPTLKE